MKKLAWGLLCCLYLPTLSAQTTAPTDGQEYTYKQKVTPTGVDNYLFSTYYYNGKNTYNLRGAQQSGSSGTVIDMKINPSGSSFAVLSQKGKDAQIVVYDLWTSNKVLCELKEVKQPTALCYSADAKRLMVATADKQLLFLDTRQYQLQNQMELPFTVSRLCASKNGYFLAAGNEQEVVLYNLETNSIRKELTSDSRLTAFAFSDDSNTFALLTADGLLSTYDTKTFFIQQSLDAMGEARHCYFHPDGKYISVVTGDSRISIVNLLDEQDRSYVDNSAGGIRDARFVKDGKQQIFLAYNTTGSMTYRLMSALAPFYTRLLADELNERMNDWQKMMPGETLEEYKLRVNDETRAQQMLLFEQEIATRMADNLLGRSEVTLGNYNPESGMLTVDFNTMPSIFLNVPQEELGDFMNPGNLEFRDALYGLTPNDNFELVYANVYNKISGKTYVFDNRNRQSLDYLRSDDRFVPLELVQQSSMEELKLQEIKEKIVTLAKQQNTISDHTNISVNARIVSDVNAGGEKIMNYQIDFAYEVEKAYSAQEDFGPGKYRAEQSGAAMSMLTIIKTAFENEFSQYVKAGKRLIVKVTGMADALPINGKIKYDGCYGDFTNEPVYKNKDLSNITVTSAEGITQNEQLAFLRAEGVRNYIDNRIPSFRQMETDYRNHIEVTEGKGGEFRRIKVEFTFVDAF